MPIGSSCARTAGWSASLRAALVATSRSSTPGHYVPVLARKPGAPRDGAPFKDGVLPAGIDKDRALSSPAYATPTSFAGSDQLTTFRGAIFNAVLTGSFHDHLILDLRGEHNFELCVSADVQCDVRIADAHKSF